MTDYKEYAKQMRENAVKNEQGNIVCSPELWEEIASVIERAIVPPCKVGDKIYRIVNGSKTIVEEQIGNANIEFVIDNGTGIQDVWWLKDYNIGKTVFLTKEEAEKKLKELK